MNLEGTEKQRNIYEGLSAIGQEIAGFYEAGLEISCGNCSMTNSSYFLLHAAREIDGGLRDILGIDYVQNKNEQGKNKKSILYSIGPEYKKLAEDWYSISKNLHSYAHRHGAWKAPRDLSEVKHLWEQYEDILERLVGSYYSIIERIEHIGQIENLEGGVIETLCNILKIPTYYNYFFRTEKSIKWFLPLKKSGLFSPESIMYDEKNNALFWHALVYLESISEQLNANPDYGKELIDIINSLVEFSHKKKKINDVSIWMSCVKIIGNIPNKTIIDILSVDQFRNWLKEWENSIHFRNFTITEIGKILPKYLNDDSMLEYSEAIIDIITDVTSLSRYPNKTRKENAHLAWDAYWIKDIFIKHYQLIGLKCSNNLILSIADKLKRVLKYKRRKHNVIFNISNNVYQIKVSRIKADGLNEGEIQFEKNQYHCAINQYDKTQIEDVDIENYIWRLHEIEPQIKISAFNFNAQEQDAFGKAIQDNLPGNVDWKLDKEYLKKIDWIYNGLYSDYLYIRFKSLADAGFKHSEDSEEILTIVLRDLLIAKCESNRDDGKDILDVLLSNKYLFPVFKRLVLLCVDKYWSDYHNLFDNFLDITPKALEETGYEVELQDIFRNHNNQFDATLKEHIKILINNVPTYYAERGEKFIAHWKYKWFSPLRDNPDFKSLYNVAKIIAEPKDNQPYEPERSSFKGGFVRHKSPLAPDEIVDMIKKSPLEFVNFIKEFKGPGALEDTFDGKPDREGLGSSLRTAVKDNQQIFIDNLHVLSAAGYYYVHNMLAGLKDAWSDSKNNEKLIWDIDTWDKILDFIITYLDRDKDIFIKEALEAQGDDSGGGKYLWVVEDIVDLIAAGCHDDKHAFDPQLFDNVEQIFNLVYPLVKGQKHPDTQRDSITYALNTTFGRTIMAYVSYALRVARATQKKIDNWGRQKYEPFFSVGIEACIWFGRYLAQMNYLDEKYTAEKIDFFAQASTNNFDWQNFMEGYLLGSLLYFDLYNAMRNNYLKALQCNDLTEEVDKKLTEHITLGYLHSYELLQTKNNDEQDSLFWKMLMDYGLSGKSNRWLEVATFFWTITGRITKSDENEKNSDDSNQKEKDKILEFWSWTHANQDIVKNKLEDDYKSFLSRMAELAIIIDRIDEENEKWLLLCAPHIDFEHNTDMFIEALAKFEDEESIKRISKIYLAVLQNTTPNYPEENIRLIVKRIYEKGTKKDADEICNMYGRRGVHFLKPLWEKYNKI